jgi:hypothetical protein
MWRTAFDRGEHGAGLKEMNLEHPKGMKTQVMNLRSIRKRKELFLHTGFRNTLPSDGNLGIANAQTTFSGTPHSQIRG